MVFIEHILISVCCETLTIASANSAFDNNLAFGVGTFTKYSTDGNGQIMYRNPVTSPVGPFILHFDALQQRWSVRYSLLVFVCITTLL